MTVFFCCTTHWDFIHYTSEHLPFCLLALATMLLFTARGREGFSAVRLFLCGLCLGAVPFAKLQGSPLALWTALFACILILAAKLPVKLRIRPILLLCAGGVAPALLLLAILLANGLFGDFYQCYIINNIAYSQGSLPLSAYVHFITHGGEPGFMLFLLPCLGYALVSALLLPLLSTRNRALCLYALGTVVVACYVIMAPGRPHGHYFLFLIPPLGLAAGAAFCGHWEKLLQERSWPRSLPHWTMLLLFPPALPGTASLQPHGHSASLSALRGAAQGVDLQSCFPLCPAACATRRRHGHVGLDAPVLCGNRPAPGNPRSP